MCFGCLCAQFHDPDTEIEWEGPLIQNPFDDNKKRQTKDYREKLYERAQEKEDARHRGRVGNASRR